MADGLAELGEDVALLAVEGVGSAGVDLEDAVDRALEPQRDRDDRPVAPPEGFPAPRVVGGLLEEVTHRPDRPGPQHLEGGPRPRGADPVEVAAVAAGLGPGAKPVVDDVRLADPDELVGVDADEPVADGRLDRRPGRAVDEGPPDPPDDRVDPVQSGELCVSPLELLVTLAEGPLALGPVEGDLGVGREQPGEGDVGLLEFAGTRPGEDEHAVGPDRDEELAGLGALAGIGRPGLAVDQGLPDPVGRVVDRLGLAGTGTDRRRRHEPAGRPVLEVQDRGGEAEDPRGRLDEVVAGLGRGRAGDQVAGGPVEPLERSLACLERRDVVVVLHPAAGVEAHLDRLAPVGQPPLGTARRRREVTLELNGPVVGR